MDSLATTASNDPYEYLGVEPPADEPSNNLLTDIGGAALGSIAQGNPLPITAYKTGAAVYDAINKKEDDPYEYLGITPEKRKEVEGKPMNPMVEDATRGFLDGLKEHVIDPISGKAMEKAADVLNQPSLYDGVKRAAELSGEGISETGAYILKELWHSSQGAFEALQRAEGRAYMSVESGLESVVTGISGGVLMANEIARLAGVPFLSDDQIATAAQNNPDIFPTGKEYEPPELLRKAMPEVFMKDSERYPIAARLDRIKSGEENLGEGETLDIIEKNAWSEWVINGPIGDAAAVGLGRAMLRKPALALLTPAIMVAPDIYRTSQQPVSGGKDADGRVMLNPKVESDIQMANAVMTALLPLELIGNPRWDLALKPAVNRADAIQKAVNDANIPVAEAAQHGVFFSEGKFLGLEKLLPEEKAVVDNAKEFLSAAKEKIVPALPEESIKPLTVEEAARNVAPEVFNEFDTLQAKRDSYAQWIRDFSDKRRADAEATAPHTAKIAELDAQITAIQEAKKGGYGKLQSLLAKREQLQEANELAINEAVKQDTPDLAAAREAYLKTDTRMRDLAEQVTEAKRIARENLPEPETIEVPKAVEELTPEQTGAASIEETAKVEEIKRTVAEEVEARLVEQGTTPDVAKTQAQVANSFFETFAKTYPKEGRDSFEWYSKFPTKLIEKGGDAKRGGYVRPKGGIVEGTKAIIKLAKGSDASTFMHESAHHYLDIMDWAAKQGDAPVRIKDDVGTIRKWLKAEDGDFTRAQHEKFARGFERYLMEGIAPSKELAGAFAKFKQWLTDIYQTVQKLRSPISEEIRGVFDRMLAENPERIVIEPEFVLKPRIKQPELPIVKLLPDESVYAKPIKEPPSLTDYVKKNGGIIDDGGEIAQLLDDKKLARSVIKDTGRTLDDMALKAWEDGYFPEKTTRPTVEEFLAKFGEEIRGNKQYSAKDSIAVESVQASRSYNTEVDKLAAELGIDTTNKTRRQFWDEVAEKQSAIEAERINTEIEDARLAAEAEADARATEFLESRGESWEPMSEKIRSLEELENDIRQEESAGKQQQGQGDTQEPAVSQGGEGTGTQAVRGDAGGARLTGREGKAKPERQRIDADGEFVKPEPVIDSNNNVNYDTLEKRMEKAEFADDMKSFVRDLVVESEDLVGAQRRGKVSHDQTFEEAAALGESMGYSPEFLLERKIGQTFTASEAKVAESIFKLLAKQAKELSQLPQTYENIAKYAAKREEARRATASFLGGVAEIGRSLNILRTMADTVKDAKALEEFFQLNNIGDTPAQIALQMELLSKLETTKEVAEFMRKSADPKELSFMKRNMQRLSELWKASILSGVKTQAMNIAGNTAMILNGILEVGVAARIGKLVPVAKETIRKYATEEAESKPFNTEAERKAYIDTLVENPTADILAKANERVQVGEAQEMLFSTLQGAKDGIKVANRFFKTGESPFDSPLEQHVNAIPGTAGEIIRFPFKGLNYVDNIFKTIAQRQNLYQLALRDAVKLGIEDNFARAAHIQKFVDTPPPEAMKESFNYSKYITAQKELEAFGKSVQMFVKTHPSAQFILPFVRISVNLLKLAGERTVFGALDIPLLGEFNKNVRANLSGINGTIARDTQIARIVVGTSYSILGAWMAHEGMITNGGPKDPNKRRVWLKNHQPYSLKVGDYWVGMGRLDPFAVLFGIPADMMTMQEYMTDDEKDSVVGLLLASISRNITSKTWMKSVSDMMEAIENKQMSFGGFLGGLASGFVPNITGTLNPDPYVREAQGIMDKIKAKISFVSQTLPPKRDFAGKPIERGTTFSPFPIREVENDPVTDTLMGIGVFPGKVGKTIDSVELTPAQLSYYRGVSDKLRHQTLSTLFESPSFASKSQEMKQKLVRQYSDWANEHARKVVKQKYPEIMRQAVEHKQKMMEPMRK